MDKGFFDTGDKCNFDPKTYEAPVFNAPLDTPKSPAMFTPCTLLHIIVGMYAYVVIRWLFPYLSLVSSFVLWFFAHGLFEIKDMYKPGTCNSKINSVGDQLSAMLGFTIMGMSFPDTAWTIKHIAIGYILVKIVAFLIYEPAGSKDSSNNYHI